EGRVMRNRIEYSGSRRSYLIAFLMVFVALAVGAPARAQKKPAISPGPKYDLQAETKIKGTVDEVKLPPKGSEKEIAHLTVKDGSNSVDVYLCPKSFFDD